MAEYGVVLAVITVLIVGVLGALSTSIRVSCRASSTFSSPQRRHKEKGKEPK